MVNRTHSVKDLHMQSGSSGSGSNWNLEMLVSEEGGVENPVQCLVLGARARTNNKLNPHNFL